MLAACAQLFVAAADGEDVISRRGERFRRLLYGAGAYAAAADEDDFFVRGQAEFGARLGFRWHVRVFGGDGDAGRHDVGYPFCVALARGARAAGEAHREFAAALEAVGLARAAGEAHREFAAALEAVGLKVRVRVIHWRAAPVHRGELRGSEVVREYRRFRAFRREVPLQLRQAGAAELPVNPLEGRGLSAAFVGAPVEARPEPRRAARHNVVAAGEEPLHEGRDEVEYVEAEGVPIRVRREEGLAQREGRAFVSRPLGGVDQR